MAIRSDITINWASSPRLITIASPSVTVTVQDLNDTLRNLEAQDPTGIEFASILTTAGKDSLGGGLLTTITLTLQNAVLAFAARGGPSYVQCTVTGGNLLAVDGNGASIAAISPTAFTQVVLTLSTAGALINNKNPMSVGEFLALK